MTDQRDSVTAAELAEYLRQVEEMWWEDYEPIQKMLGFLAALRRERDEARDRHAISQSVAGDMASALDDARADIAKKDAALRDLLFYVPFLIPALMVGNAASKKLAVCIQELGTDAEAALAPAAQGNRDGVPCCNNRTLCEPECAGPAPAPSVGETVLDWSRIAKAAGTHGVRYRTNSALEAFLRDIAATPTTGEPDA